jgi:hypothetical protein
MRVFVTALALGIAIPRLAWSDDKTTYRRVSVLDRPHTVAIWEGGIIALPTAPISSAFRGGKTPILGPIGNGDATIETGAHLLYRAGRDWAFGAEGIFAPNPTTDPNYSTAVTNIPRTHSRSYLFLGGEVRYFPFKTGAFETWIGATGGGVIVADRFSTNTGPTVPSILGTSTVTVGSEGFAVGVQTGFDYSLTEQLTIGLALRADQWYLPSEKPFSQESSCDVVEDCQTLTGRVTALFVGLTAGYHIPL